MPIQECPSRDQLDSFQSGDLADDALAASLSSHVEGCSTCQRALETVIGESSDAVLAALLDDAEPAPFAAEASCRSAVERVAALAGTLSSGSEATVATASPASAEGEVLPVASIREYKLLAKLGEGGMGAVYKALHTRLDKVVALKILPADRIRDGGAVARFQREMKAVGRLDHPNIVRAMDAGEEAGMHFLVMEYVEGLDLSLLAKNVGPLPVADACELIRQAAHGLQEAHEHGMVHRDIKPSNLIFAKSKKKKGAPTVKILDLGLALLSEALAPDAGGLTTSGQMMGTLDYMAPEQGGDSHQVDIRADIYSLGATLYRLLTGSAPFAGDKWDTPVKKILALATQAPSPVQARRPDVPPPLAAIVNKMLAKDPAERYSTPDELSDALAPFCQGADLTALLARGSTPSESPAIPASEIGTHAHLSSPSGDTAPTVDRAVGNAVPGVPSAPLSPGGRGAGGEGAAGVAAGVNRRAPAAMFGRKIPHSLAIAAACGGLALAVLLGITFYIQTQQGTIQVEINDPAIKVTLDNDGNTVFQGADKKHAIKLKPGPHGMTITRGDFFFDTTQFELKRKGIVALKVNYLPGKIQVADDAGKVLEERPVPSYALQFDGVDDYVELPKLQFDGSHAFTMEIWAEVQNPLASPQLMQYSGVPGCRAKIQVGTQQPTTLAWVTAGSPKPPEDGLATYSDVSFGDGCLTGWQHLALCWSPDGVLKFYRNGRLCPNPSTQTRQFSWPKGSPSLIGANKKADGVVQELLRGSVRQVRFSKGVRYAQEFSPEEEWKPDPNTLALYRFDEGAGDVLYDTSGHNHHGKIVGAKWVQAEAAGPATPPVRYALQFGSDKSNVAISTLRVDKQAPITIEAYVKPGKTTTDWGTIFSRERHGLSLDPSGKWNFAWGPVEAVGPVFTPDRRVHVAGVFDQTRVRLFLDGVQVGGKNLEMERQPGEALEFFIGNSGRFAGLIDQIRVSKTARYNQDFKPEAELTPDADTLALYHFDEGQGDVLKDTSGNNHHGKIVGAKWVKAAPATSPQENFALEFDGVNDHVQLPAVGHDFQSPLTVEAWVVPFDNQDTIAAESAQVVLARPGCFLQQTPFGWQFYCHKRSVIQGRGARDQRYHLVAQWENNRCRLFVNGRGAISPDSKEPFTAAGILPRVLGAEGTWEGVAIRHYFRGRLEELRISDLPRYQADFTPPDPALSFSKDNHTLALYHFDEGEGTELKDSSGNNHHGKIVGAKWVKVDGSSVLTILPLTNRGLQFDGIDDSVFFSELAAPAGPNKPITVEGWFTPASVEDGSLFTMPYASGDGLIRLTMMSGGPHAVRVAQRKEVVGYSRSDTLTPGKLFHLAAGYNGNTWTFWLNGKKLGEKADRYSWNPPVSSTFPAVFGRDSGIPPSTGQRRKPFSGAMHELRISQVTRYREDFTPKERFDSDADTLALYHFDEGQGDVLNDSSGHNHHGKIVGAKWVKSDGSTTSAAPTVQAPPPPGDYALRVSEEADQVDVSAVVLKAREPWTVEGWVTPQEPLLNSGEAALVFVVHPVWLSVQNRGGAKWAVGGPTSRPAPTIYASDKIVAGQRTHVAYQNGPQGVSFFVNGVRQGDHMPIVWQTPESTLRLRHRGNPKVRDVLFNGAFDELRVSKVERYQENFTPQPRFEPDADTVALYHFDEGSGTELKDSSGNNRHGKITGAKWARLDSEGKVSPASTAPPAATAPSVETPLPAQPAVPAGFALHFTAAEDQLDTSNLFLNAKETWTIEGWVMPDDPLPRDGEQALVFLVDQVWLSVHNRYPGARWTTGGPLAKPGPAINKSDKFRVGERAHLALQHGPKGVSMFVNGVRQGEPLPFVFLNERPRVRIRTPANPSRRDMGFYGHIDEVRVSDVERYQENFTPSPRFEPDADTLALYHFDEGQGEVLTDSSGNNRHGKIVGAKWVPVDAPPAEDNATQASPLGIPEPPPLEEWLKGRTILTVAQDGSGQFKTIQAALLALKKGEVVKILDRGPYHEPIWMEQLPEDTGIISESKTILEVKDWKAPGWGPPEAPAAVGHYLGHGNGFRLSGLIIRHPVKTNAQGLVIVDLPGLVLEDCLIEAPEEQPGEYSSVLIRDEGRGGADGAPLIIRNCVVSAHLHVVTDGIPGTTQALIERTFFRGPQARLWVAGPYKQLVIRHNVWDEKAKDFSLILALLEPAERMQISNNTNLGRLFVDPRIRPKSVSICGNLQAGGYSSVEALQQDAPQIAAAGVWKVQGNGCWYPLGTSAGRGLGAAAIVSDPQFLSMDAGAADYLRLPVDGKLAKLRLGGDWPAYIGALPPGPAPKEGDWFTRLRERWSEPLQEANVNAPPFNVAEPPPLVEWLKGRTVLTVAQDGKGQFKTIQAALDALQPGQVVKVLDKGPYRERLDLPVVAKDTGLISEVQSILEVPEWKLGWKEPIPGTGQEAEIYLGHWLNQVDGFRMSGFEMHFPKSGGKYSDGKWLRRLTTQRTTAFVLEKCAIHGVGNVDGEPLVISNWDSGDGTRMSVVVRECVLEGSVVIATHDVPLPHDPARRSTAVIQHNYFLGTGTDHHLMIHGQSLDGLVVRHNVFAGKSGNDIVLADQGMLDVLELTNNSLSSTSGLTIGESVPNNVTIRNNLRSREGFVLLQNGAEKQFRQAALAWKMDHNSYPAATAAASPEVLRPPHPPGDLSILPRFLSKVPQEVDYMRIPADDPLATAGAGGAWPAYLGALPPGPAPKEGDWFTRLREWWQASEKAEPTTTK